MSGDSGEFRIPDDLSGLLDGDVGTSETPSNAGAVMVIGDIDLEPGSPYVCAVQASDDVIIRLPRDAAVRYAMTVLAAAHRAHYGAAVYAQALDIIGRRKDTGAVETEELARYLLGQWLQDLPDLDDEATAPLRFQPSIHRDGTGRVRVSVAPHTGWLTGWNFLECRSHALAVLDVATVCDLDTVWRNTIAGGFGAGEDRGRAAVGELTRFYQHKPEIGAVEAYGAGRMPRPVRVPGPPPGAKPAGRGKKRRR